MLKSSLCDYSDAYMLVSGNIRITGAGADDNAKEADEREKGVIFKNPAKLLTKLYVSVVTLSTQDNTKLLLQFKSGFKRTTNWNKYQSKVSIHAPNPYLDYLIDPSFQVVNIIFVLSFENNTDRTVHIGYYLPKVEVKDYNVMIDGQTFFGKPVKNNL